MKSLAIISDIHGCLQTLFALVEKIPSDHEIILAGDLIDRGPDSAGVVNWAMNGNIRCVLGNHEDMMLYHNRRFRKEHHSYLSPRDWTNNGGWRALDSWGGTIPDNILDWVDGLPFFIREGEFEISHTGLGGHLTANRFQKLWYREGSDGELLRGIDDGVYRVFGHTQKQEPWIEKNFAMIDTGCAYKDRDMGKLTAFLLPEKTIIQQIYID